MENGDPEKRGYLSIYSVRWHLTVGGHVGLLFIGEIHSGCLFPDTGNITMSKRAPILLALSWIGARNRCQNKYTVQIHENLLERDECFLGESNQIGRH